MFLIRVCRLGKPLVSSESISSRHTASSMRSRLAKIETAVAVQTMAADGGWNSGHSYRFFRLAPNRTNPELRQYLSRRFRRLLRRLIRGSISQSSSALPNEILNFNEQQRDPPPKYHMLTRDAPSRVLLDTLCFSLAEQLSNILAIFCVVLPRG